MAHFSLDAETCASYDTYTTNEILSQQEAGSSRWQSASRKSLDRPEAHRPGAADNRSPASFHHSTIPLFHHSNIPPFHHSIIPILHHSTIPLPVSPPAGGGLPHYAKQSQFAGGLAGNGRRSCAKQSQFGGGRVNVKYGSEKGLPEIWAITCLRKQSQFAVRDCLPRRRGGRFGVLLARPGRDRGTLVRNKAILPGLPAGSQLPAVQNKANLARQGRWIDEG